MKNIELLIQKNPCKKPLRKNHFRISKDKSFSLIYKDKEITGETIKKILADMQSIHDPYNLPIKLVFSSDRVRFSDKLTYITFECLCYLVSQKKSLFLFLNPTKDILTSGIEYSPLQFLLPHNHSIENFKNHFRFDINKGHYRKVMNPEKNPDYLSDAYTDITNFLKNCNLDVQCIDDVVHVVAELIGNGCEHGKTDCLVDIDISDDYFKEGSNGHYYGINIVILNFSSLLIGEAVKKKMKSHKNEIGKRYQGVQKAYDFHKNHFTPTYTEEDFFNLSAFQDKISGRSFNDAGGTGLTVLIRSLQKQSDNDKCYVLSGSRMLAFLENYLDYNSEDWLGFNESKDYLSDLPNKDLIVSCPIFFPGTAYNLNFVMKRKDD